MQKRMFSDLDFNFGAHPVTKDITRTYDENSIKQSIKSLLLTRNFERPFHSEIGSPIRQLMFDPPGPMLIVMLRKAIIDVITMFEPRVEIIDIGIEDYIDRNAIDITLEFKIANTEKPITVQYTLERTR